MAKYKAGPGVAEARGTIGGTVFSRGRYGLYMRSGASPVQPRTPGQVAARAAFTAMSQRWRDTVTGPERAAWEKYASLTPISDVFGDKQALAGNAMYVRFNARWYARGGTPVDAAPATPGEAPMLNVTLSGTTLAGIKIETWLPLLLAADKVSILMCKAPTSQARNFFNGPFTHCDWIAGTALLPQTIIQAAGVQIGQRWFFEFRAYVSTGRVGPTSRFQVDILA